jgi:hypothetical protein
LRYICTIDILITKVLFEVQREWAVPDEGPQQVLLLL